MNHSTDTPAAVPHVVRGRLWCCGLLLAALFGAYGWRLFHIQGTRHSHYEEIRLAAHRRADPLPARRGDITDARGITLATDRLVQRLVYDLKFLGERTSLVAALREFGKHLPGDEDEKKRNSELLSSHSLESLQISYLNASTPVVGSILGRPSGEIRDAVLERLRKRASGEFVIEPKLDYQIGRNLRDALENAHLGRYDDLRDRIGAVVIRDYYERHYPLAGTFDQIVGRFAEPATSKTGDDSAPATGVSGIEKSFDHLLGGSDGSRYVEVDGRGEELAAYRGGSNAATDGHSIRLTLDTGLQEIVEKEVDNPSPANPDDISVRRMNPNVVIVALFEPSTMALRALVARDFREGREATGASMNYLADYRFEPGSTVKMATVAAALADRKVGLQEFLTIDPDGDKQYKEKGIEPIKDEGSNASLSPEGILVKSSNIGAFLLAKRIGRTRFREWLDSFGFTSVTGITLPFERTGKLSVPWSYEAFSRNAYGYSFDATPAHLCSMLGCILNDGLWRPLRVIESVTDISGNPTEGTPELASRQVIPEKTARSVQGMLLEVVRKGTATRAQSERYEIGGKTGTAKQVLPKGGYHPTLRNISFAGFVNVAGQPRLAGYCIIDAPKMGPGMNSGGKLAAPLFRRVAEKAMEYYQVPPMLVEDKSKKEKSEPVKLKLENVKGKPRVR
ncbi:MAG: Stage sporulation protein [Verrucomicrobiota bacterium]|jgi:cell division protein FtsI/penicillin-binding protein 2